MITTGEGRMEQNSIIRAFYSDETENYRSPSEPEPGDMVAIRFRTARNGADRVWYVSDDGRIPMDKVCTEGIFDFYQITICLGAEMVYYYFEIETNGTV